MNTPIEIKHRMRPVPQWLLWAAFMLVVLVSVFFLIDPPPAIQRFTDGENIAQRVKEAGHFGPLIVIALMTVAVVISPLPSAPIAVASGALYGHGWGALYVLAGAQLGAMICFGMARGLGYDTLHHWFGDKLKVGLLGSQRALSYGVLVSRLLPFISFDLISYAAGLTVIRFWRFAVATLIGIAPTSFLLAHVGSEISSGEWTRMGITVLLLGGVTLIPIVIVHFFRRSRLPKSQDRKVH